MTIDFISNYIISRLLESGYTIKAVYKAKTNSFYIRFKHNNKIITIRISDHDSPWRYDYDFNINNKDFSLNQIEVLFNRLKNREI